MTVHDHHLTADDMPLFTTLRMTAFGQAVIDIANDSAYDEWTFFHARSAMHSNTRARRAGSAGS